MKLTFQQEINLPRAEVLRRLEELRAKYKPSWREAFAFKNPKFALSTFVQEKDCYRVRWPTNYERIWAYLYLDEKSPDTTTLRLEHDIRDDKIFVIAFSIIYVIYLGYTIYQSRDMQLSALLVMIALVGGLGGVAIFGFWLYYRINRRLHCTTMEKKLKNLAGELVAR